MGDHATGKNVVFHIEDELLGFRIPSILNQIKHVARVHLSCIASDKVGKAAGANNRDTV